MSPLTPSAAPSVTVDHRTQLAAEAVVSAYLHEISVPRRSRELLSARRPGVPQPNLAQSRAVGRAASVGRERSRSVARSRSTGLSVG